MHLQSAVGLLAGAIEPSWGLTWLVPHGQPGHSLMVTTEQQKRKEKSPGLVLPLTSSQNLGRSFTLTFNIFVGQMGLILPIVGDYVEN